MYLKEFKVKVECSDKKALDFIFERIINYIGITTDCLNNIGLKDENCPIKNQIEILNKED